MAACMTFRFFVQEIFEGVEARRAAKLDRDLLRKFS
jgi:hypothetical protein